MGRETEIKREREREKREKMGRGEGTIRKRSMPKATSAGAKADAKANGTVDMGVFDGAHGLERAHPQNDFIWSKQEEPHAGRRKQIIAAHKEEIRKLFGPEPMTKWIVLAVVTVHLGTALLLRNHAWTWQFFLAAYVVGATCTQNLFLAIHEISHNLAFRSAAHNRYLAILANLPIAIPYAAKFKGYHIEHHKHQGVDGIDTDVPTKLETMLFNNVLGKLFFATCQILFYALRPTFVRAQIWDKWFTMNLIAQMTFNASHVYFTGSWAPLAYLLLSDFLAGSLHPCASHFIAEHYVFVGDQETYSYYGPLNALCFNVGYHNEHHDFPNIPWSRLPALKKLAPEFYDSLPYHKSWPLVLWKFITDPNVGTFNRVKREDKNNLSIKTICPQAAGL